MRHRLKHQAVRISLVSYLNDREAHLLGPAAHDALYGLATCLAQRGPQVLSERVAVLMSLQVDVHTSAEILPHVDGSRHITR